MSKYNEKRCINPKKTSTIYMYNIIKIMNFLTMKKKSRMFPPVHLHQLTAFNNRFIFFVHFFCYYNFLCLFFASISLYLRLLYPVDRTNSSDDLKSFFLNENHSKEALFQRAYFIRWLFHIFAENFWCN